MVVADLSRLLDGHFWHVVLLASWMPIFGLLVAGERFAAHRRRSRLVRADRWSAAPTPTRATTEWARPRSVANRGWRQGVALASGCAATVHLAVMPPHFAQSAWYGAFFLVAAASQLVYAAAVLVRPTRRLLLAGTVGCGAVVVLWLLTRTIGVPIGPARGATEPFGLLDVLASAAELGAAGSGVLALRSLTGEPVWRWSAWSPVIRCAAPVCLAGTLVASVLGARS